VLGKIKFVLAHPPDLLSLRKSREDDEAEKRARDGDDAVDDEEPTSQRGEGEA
jgi:hypothetical protein